MLSAESGAKIAENATKQGIHKDLHPKMVLRGPEKQLFAWEKFLWYVLNNEKFFIIWRKI